MCLARSRLAYTDSTAIVYRGVARPSVMVGPVNYSSPGPLPTCTQSVSITSQIKLFTLLFLNKSAL